MEKDERMKPGRELDALVADKVMGLTLNEEGIWLRSGKKSYWPDTQASDEEIYLPNYSTDIAAAWEVVNAMKSKGMIFHYYDCHKDGSIEASFFGMLDGEEFTKSEALALEKSAPLVICLAALKAIGVEV